MNNTITAKFIDDKFLWSEKTFGKGNRTKGVIAHIKTELVEVEKEPTDATEWADIILLAMDGASRNGISGQQLIEAILTKQARNRARAWPPPNDDPDVPIHHIKITFDPDRCFPEEYHEDNGQYVNVCTNCTSHFMGHKRRIFCKLCLNKPKNEIPSSDFDHLHHHGL